MKNSVTREHSNMLSYIPTKIKNKMKKIIAYAVTVIAAFITGMEFNAWYYNFDSLFEANNFKRELVNKQAIALDKAYKVIDNNDLLDTDGSDDMADYLHAVEVVDSLYDTQR